MRKILTQDEIDSLLSSAAEGAGRSDASTAGVLNYDFKRPDRVAKDQIRSLQLLHERFARNATTSLSAYLRTTTELSILSVEQFSYSEFLMALPDPTAFYAIAMPPFDALGALELSPSVAFTMVDRMLGGSGRVGAPERALTEIEQNVVDAVVKLLLDHLAETWRAVAVLQFQIQGRETRPQMLQVAGRNEIVILLVFDFKVGDSRGMLHICIPASVIEATGSTFVQGWQQAKRPPTDVEQRWLAENLSRVSVSLTSRLEARLRARDLLALAPGHVLSLGIPVQTPIDVYVGDVAKFKGRLAKKNGAVAVFIESSDTTRLAPLEVRE